MSWATPAHRVKASATASTTGSSRAKSSNGCAYAGGFLEWADVYGVLKGTPGQPLADALDAGRDALLEMDIQGVESVLEQFPDAEVVFLVAPSPEVQEARLRKRGTDSDDDIGRRLVAAAAEETEARGRGLRIVTNDAVSEVVDLVSSIIEARRRS